IMYGPCGCDTSDMDSDGVLDCQDDCPNNPELIMYGPCGCDTSDMDGDGVLDCEDMCPGIHD
ncbi:MAG: hypothetical protein GTO02_19725, partial [Candidatus Dadabacteria bacterium]|nr:hypothetical protein [Candidatus Dadabacteria bacterium]NIQ16536.1 hypothetical protein [Candidatus Dadabacteria bacterium]